MRPLVLVHPQWRSSLPRAVRRDSNTRLFARLKSTPNTPRSSEHPRPFGRHNDENYRMPTSSPEAHAKNRIQRGPPERILIYHGGTGRTMFLGSLRLTTILLFGVSCVYLAPEFEFSDDPYPWYLAPAVIIGGTIPLLFVSYTAAPFVNFVHLALPVFARRSREQATQYAKNLPPTATLFITTTRIIGFPRQTEVRMGNLVGDKSWLRPVSFRDVNPAPRKWYEGRQYYTADKLLRKAEGSKMYYPEVWGHVYRQMQNNGPRNK